MAESIVADPSGNAYVAGSVQDQMVSFGSITVTNLGAVEGFVAKYDISGNVLWVRQGGAVDGGYVYILDIALDGAGNVFAAGYFKGDFNFGGSRLARSVHGGRRD